MQQYDFQAGAVLLIDKPLEWTSFDVVNKVRNALRKALGIRKIKVGHAGTLDPLATGLLILCTGKFTKKIESYQALYKVYDGHFQLGATTPSYDAETAIEQQLYDDVEEAINRPPQGSDPSSDGGSGGGFGGYEPGTDADPYSDFAQ